MPVELIVGGATAMGTALAALFWALMKSQTQNAERAETYGRVMSEAAVAWADKHAAQREKHIEVVTRLDGRVSALVDEVRALRKQRE